MKLQYGTCNIRKNDDGSYTEVITDIVECIFVEGEIIKIKHDFAIVNENKPRDLNLQR